MCALKLVSCLGENTYPINEVLAAYLSETLGQAVQFLKPDDWVQTCTAQLPQGKAGLGWLCGLLYTLQQDAQPESCYQVLGRPVFTGQTEPVYYSYLVVHRDSALNTLADLDGKRLVINDPDSYSGHHALWAHWAGLEQAPRFASIQESGRHSVSMRQVALGQADVAAIDYTVFDYWQQQSGELQAVLAQLRIMTQLKSAPTPPFVVHRSLAPERVAQLRDALLGIAQSPWLPRFQAVGLQAVRPAADADYDILRTDYQRSQAFLAAHYPKR